ncbi:MAG TPA: hypothetical protein VG962_05170 [Steroidobacteraceae bacterium]|nr:hypothetical protein [Steroidobacteraceae bacterium]
MTTRFASIVLLSVALLLGACDPQKQPAEAAYAQIEASVAPVRESLEKYAPQEYDQLNQMMDQMRGHLNSGDYQGALDMRRKVMEQLAAASSAAGLKRNEVVRELSSQWKTLSASVPDEIKLVTDRVNTLLKAGKLPNGVTRDVVVQSQSTMAEISGQWNAAMSSAQHNNLDDAVTQANKVKKRCADVATSLGLKLSES